MSGTTLTVPNLTYTGTLTGVSQNLSGNLTANNIVSSNNVTYSGTLTGGTGVIAIGTNQIYKDANGSIGIGTASPGAKLEVSAGSAAFSYSSASRFIITNNNAYATNTYFGVNTLYLSNASTTAGTGSGIAFGSTGSGSGSVCTIAGIATNNSGYGSALVFQTRDTSGNDAERMRLDSSGNLLVGATSLSSGFSSYAQIEASGTTGGVLINSANSNIGRLIFSNNNASGAEGLIRYDGSNKSMQFWTNASEVGRFDASGNLGLGVTPSAWSGIAGAAFQNAGNGAIYSLGTDNIKLSQNVYFTNTGYTERYVQTRAATQYTQENGAHSWHTAASGTAGNPITFTRAMTLDASCALIVNNISAPDSSNFKITSYGSVNGGIALQNPTNWTGIAQSGNNVYFDVGRGGSAGNLYFRRSSTNATSMTLDSSGNLSVTGTITSGSSLYAPIMYDSNNSSYYCDPGSTSNFSRLNVAGYSVRSTLELDLRLLDQSTYYPVTIDGIQATRVARIRVTSLLNGASVPSWSTHSNGFALICDWSVNTFGWGTISVSRTIDNFLYNFASVNPVGGITQMGNGSLEVIWLRGGGYYYVEADGDITATIRTSTYTIYGQSVSPLSSAYNNVWAVASSQAAFYTIYCNSLGTGTVYSNGGVLTSTNPSDNRLKDNITPINWGLSELLQFSPKSWTWKDNKSNQGNQYGWIAQEVKEIIPDLITEFNTDDGVRYGLDKDGIIVVMHNAIKQLSVELELLKQKINGM